MKYALVVAELEVDAAILDADVRKVGTRRSAAGLGPRPRRRRRPLEQSLEIPVALRVLHQVQARFNERERGELHVPRPECSQPEPDLHRAGVYEVLRAKGGILTDDDIVQAKAGRR